MAGTLGENGWVRSLLALLAPFVALVLAWLLWSLIQPQVWVLFYPAVFISCWIGGKRLGLIATAISSALVWWFFLRSESLLTIDPRHLFEVGVFFATGAAFAYFHDRLTRAATALAAKKQLEADLRELTDLHEQVKQLANERRVFAALVENSSDFIGIAEASGKPVYLNPAGRRMVGLSTDHPIEQTQIAEYYPVAERSFASNVILKVMVEEGHWQGETYFRNWQTDEAIPVSDKHFMIRDPESGETLGMATVTRDISDVRKARDELQRTNDELVEARGFLENVLESSTEYSIIATDLEARILAWNAGAARIYGYEAHEVVGRSTNMLSAPEEIQSGLPAKLHERALAEGKAAGLVCRIRKDGSAFRARVTITRRNDARGRAIGCVIVSHDVTAEQRHVEEQQFLARVGEALQASLDQAATVERIAQMVVGFMGDTCAIDVLEEDDKLVRMKVVHADPSKASLAKALEQVTPGRNHPIWQVVATRWPLLLTEVPPELLHSIAKNEEHLRLLEALNPASAMLLPLVARGRIIAVLSIVSCRADHRYQAEDLRLAEELGRRASLALDNARLYEVAQRAIRARDQVLGIVAHDLRNPLGTVLMQASLLGLRATEADRTSSKAAQAIERAAMRMKRLIQDLLDVTRMEGGRLAIERARIPSARVLSEAVEAQKGLAASAALELRLDLRDDVPEIWADRDRLLQIFENLIGNAIKFTKPGGRILAGAAARGREVLFWVSDTGCGIAAEDVPHVFERHWQAKEAAGRGAGLGLPIVKGLVEAHDGRIWAESRLGQGTTFFFTIPTAAAAEEHASESAAPGP